MYTELIPMTLLQAVAPYLDISLAMFISLGSMSNCWRAGPSAAELLSDILWERDCDKTGDTQFMDFVIERLSAH